MPGDYRVPNSYVEEAPITSAGINNATAATLFVGVSAAGATEAPVQVESWSDFVNSFGVQTGLDDVPDPVSGSKLLSYLGYEVYSYFQNGGRPAIIARSVGASAGTQATAAVPGKVASGTTKVVSNVARTGSTATLTSAAHGYAVNDVVTVSGITNNSGAFNVAGARLTAVTTDTFSYTTPTSGTVASAAATGTTPAVAKVVAALSFTAKSFDGASNYVTSSDGDHGLAVEVVLRGTTATGAALFNLNVYKDGSIAESFTGLTVTGADQGTTRVDTAVRNSSLVTLGDGFTEPVATAYPLSPFAGGVDPHLPTSAELKASAVAAVSVIDSPVIVVIAGYVDSTGTFQSASVNSSDFGNRQDVFIINDAAVSRGNSSVASYVSSISSDTALGANTGDSYVASYTPWITVSDPRSSNALITIPPGGAVAGVMSRTDSNVGVFRTPAGVIANVVNAVDVETIFTQTQLGNLNDADINVIRPVPSSGICIMGGRTRKKYGIDRYVAARRTLIFIKESMRRSTQFAVFENNDQRLWANLIVTAESILRPLWEAGGLKGASAQEAYFIKCDADINTPLVVDAGEVHMEIGVALESPAEFIIIRVAQSSGGATTTDLSA